MKGINITDIYAAWCEGNKKRREEILEHMESHTIHQTKEWIKNIWPPYKNRTI